TRRSLSELYGDEGGLLLRECFAIWRSLFDVGGVWIWGRPSLEQAMELVALMQEAITMDVHPTRILIDVRGLEYATPRELEVMRQHAESVGPLVESMGLHRALVADRAFGSTIAAG